MERLSWSWLHGSWIYNYLCNQFLSPLKLWVRTPFMAKCTRYTLCDKVCQGLVTGGWFSPGTPVSSTNKTDRHDITEIVLKMALSTIYHTILTELEYFIQIYQFVLLNNFLDTNCISNPGRYSSTIWKSVFSRTLQCCRTILWIHYAMYKVHDRGVLYRTLLSSNMWGVTFYSRVDVEHTQTLPHHLYKRWCLVP